MRILNSQQGHPVVVSGFPPPQGACLVKVMEFVKLFDPPGYQRANQTKSPQVSREGVKKPTEIRGGWWLVDGDFVEKHRDMEIFWLVWSFFCFFKDLVDRHFLLEKILLGVRNGQFFWNGMIWKDGQMREFSMEESSSIRIKSFEHHHQSFCSFEPHAWMVDI